MADAAETVWGVEAPVVTKMPISDVRTPKNSRMSFTATRERRWRSNFNHGSGCFFRPRTPDDPVRLFFIVATTPDIVAMATRRHAIGTDKELGL
jgi:hypothetical protein